MHYPRTFLNYPPLAPFCIASLSRSNSPVRFLNPPPFFHLRTRRTPQANYNRRPPEKVLDRVKKSLFVLARTDIKKVWDDVQNRNSQSSKHQSLMVKIGGILTDVRTVNVFAHGSRLRSERK